MIIVDEIRGEMFAATWPLIEPFLQSGIDRVVTEQTTDKIRRAFEEGRYRLWAIYQQDKPLPLLAAAATYVRQTNRGLVAVIDTIGGHDMGEWLRPAIDTFAELAKAHGVAFIEVEGRPGWERVLPDFTKKRVVLERALI